ncbi:MAG: hypothetical protein NC923_04130 [Candidatus Omnitrophica bacterium]|nr:hypothetical protein [Candidatus Omnitrophota bacterium]
MRPTEEWLRAINERFRKEDIPPRARPFLALKAFSEDFKCNVSIPSEVTNTICEWFYKNTQEGSHKIGSLYRGVYYFDSCFWPVYIPIVYGKVPLNAFDSLPSMSETLKNQIKANTKELWSFILLWVDCLDYAYGYDDIIKNPRFKGLALNFIKSADKELRAAVSLLLQDFPETKAIESTRMAVEMFFKAIIIIATGWNEDKVRKKIGHSLIVAAQEAFNFTQSKEIKEIEKKLSFYPEINERYAGKDWKARELWKGYCLAQVVATIFTRLHSDRDTRQQILRKID